ncbi:MAG: hypothetical protein WDO19_18600 [Bacteroidota bacterium]
MLNLFNNAFYSVAEKKKSLSAADPANEYEPKISMSTKRMTDHLEIKIRDNGNGIPQLYLIRFSILSLQQSRLAREPG